ncbi:putative germin-like protein 2-1 [Apium graveolens]|uniref:putative germin-like protein 2-1 n=1 Tax=Apium graveolens TaxID=4045 RepID=UPI003D7B7DD2
MASSLDFKILLIGSFSIMTCFVALALDVNPLQDFCVADTSSPVLVNGLVCKDPNNVTEADFFFSGLNVAGNTSNLVGSVATPVTVALVPGLNTLSISLVRTDFAPRGINPPHTNPRASEIMTVIQGRLRVGFVTSNPDYRHITTVLNEGDVFVFPQGLTHYQQNIGKGKAVTLAAFNSQNPGIITIADAVFGANPNISANVLAKAFQLNRNTVLELQGRF